jgi:hypothetical protein
LPTVSYVKLTAKKIPMYKDPQRQKQTSTQNKRQIRLKKILAERDLEIEVME